MKALLLATFLATCALCHDADAKAYVPLAALDSAPFSTRSAFLPVAPEARPFLPGMRPVEVELLEDALRRKRPLKVGDSRAKAHAVITGRAMYDPRIRSQLKGTLAEALYLEKNPKWGYAKSNNDPQVDVETRIRSRGSPFTAQIKTHTSAAPTVYARDMVGDHKADRFLVPDDHVRPLKDHWRTQIDVLQARGLTFEADEARKQFSRVRGLGFTAKELDDRLTKAARYCLRERNAAYISFGAGLAMAFGPDLWECWRTGSLSQPAMFRMTRAGSILAAERAAAYGLARYGTGALRGALRGNLLTGLVILGVGTGFSIYENGGTQAFRSASFYTHLGGGVGALTLGLAVGVPAALFGTTAVAALPPPFNLAAPIAGPALGLLAGGGAGIIGYIGGEAASRKILEAVNPAFLHDAENAVIRDAREQVETSLVKLQRE